MPKDKPPKLKGIANKHLHARTTFLYQAATYLTMQTGTAPISLASPISTDQVPQPDKLLLSGKSGLALQLGFDLQTVSRKGQVRLSAELKRSMCKTCNNVLIPGRTATQSIENDSKGGKKPWADVLVIKCFLCGCTKRFPVGATRQKRKGERDESRLRDPTSKVTDDGDQSTTSAFQATTDMSPSSN